MASNAAVAENFSDILAELGGVPIARVRREPPADPGTLDDCGESRPQYSLHAEK